jgi:hypothetical protein
LMTTIEQIYNGECIALFIGLDQLWLGIPNLHNAVGSIDGWRLKSKLVVLPKRKFKGSPTKGMHLLVSGGWPWMRCLGGLVAMQYTSHTGYLRVTSEIRHSYLGSNVGVMWG